MRIKITMTGTTPLVCHNVEHLSNPDHPITKSIKALTSKKAAQKTEADRIEIAHLEFLGGLYIHPVGGRDDICMPTANVKRCLQKAAMLRREGKLVERGLLTTDMVVPLVYPGPRDPEKLWADGGYRFSTPVRVQAQIVQRTRPRFPTWSVETSWELLEEVMDFGILKRIAEEAGRIEGMGDHRSLGSGRFAAKVEVMEG